MVTAVFDTMSIAKRLQAEFGVPEKQAEGIATVLHENFVGNVATKDDIAQVRTDMENLEERLVMKMTLRLGGIMLGALAFFEVLNRAFPITGG